MSHVFLRLREVQKRTGKGKTTIYKEIKSGKFPKQFPNGEGTVVWLESEILHWQETKIKERVNNPF